MNIVKWKLACKKSFIHNHIRHIFHQRKSATNTCASVFSVLRGNAVSKVHEYWFSHLKLTIPIVSNIIILIKKVASKYLNLEFFYSNIQLIFLWNSETLVKVFGVSEILICSKTSGFHWSLAIHLRLEIHLNSRFYCCFGAKVLFLNTEFPFERQNFAQFLLFFWPHSVTQKYLNNSGS